jgi:hypothetical protein
MYRSVVLVEILRPVTTPCLEATLSRRSSLGLPVVATGWFRQLQGQAVRELWLAHAFYLTYLIPTLFPSAVVAPFFRRQVSNGANPPPRSSSRR